MEPLDEASTLNINSNFKSLHMRSVLYDIDSTSFALGSDTSALIDALEQHGILYEGLDRKGRRMTLIHHLLYGHCHRSLLPTCQVVANTAKTMATVAVSLSTEILSAFREHKISLTLFEDLCILLGFRPGQNFRNSVEVDLLNFYETRLINLCNPHSFYQLSRFLTDYDSMDKNMLMRLCGMHGLNCHGPLQALRDRLFTHVCGGHCKPANGSNTCPPSCESTVNELPSSGLTDFGISLLAATVHKMRLKTLRRVASMYHLHWMPTDSITKLRRIVKHFICSSAKGKKSLESTARSQARNSQVDVMNDARCRWPEVPSQSLLNTFVADFKNATSSSTLATGTCASCAEKVICQSMKTLPILEIDITLLKRPDFCESLAEEAMPDQDDLEESDPSILEAGQRWLHPDVPCPPLPYTDGILKDILLDRDGVVENNGIPHSIRVCKSCCQALSSGRMPPLAIANRLFIGAVPEELRNLTAVEESMIALCRARAIIVRLKGGQGNHESYQEDGTTNSSPIHQRALRGHVIVHPQRPDVVSELLPPSIEDIVAPICVVYTGPNAPSAEWLRKKAKPLLVRADRVRKALVWLKAHNYLYRNITINHKVLNDIAGLPSLPVHVEFSSEPHDEVVTSGYANDGRLDERDCTQTDDNIPFESVLIADVDPKASSNELRAAAIRHFKDPNNSYLDMPHDSKPENEFCNPTLFPKLYPSLFPYGLGGFENGHRRAPVSLKMQAKHFLNLADDRFQVHHSFTFIIFNIMQRRQVLWQSNAKVKRGNFHHTAEIFAGISPEDIETVSSRFARGDHKTAYSDSERRVLRLMKEVKLVNRHLPGSNAARLAMRNEIRALMLSHGLPSFFITINPADIYNPLVKFLAGGDIDLDNLLPTDVPAYWDQSMLIAKNPVIAANFFNIYIKAFINSILGFDAESTYVKSGVLGVVKAHYGCVEAQGRGTLHCHMLVWIEGGLDPNALKEKLLREPGGAFEQRLIAYLNHSIQSSIPSCDGNPPPDPLDSFHPCLTRGPVRRTNETDADYNQRCSKDLSALAEACQRHSHKATCYKSWKGPPHEKKCRFELDESNTVGCTTVNAETGELNMAKVDGMVNNFNSAMLRAVRCNMDIKFIGSGSLAKAALYYITDYISKAQLKAHVAFAALETAMRKMGEPDNNDDDVASRAKKLLIKCANALVGLQELSAPQVASYVLDLEDHFTSHDFRHLYWPSFESYINRQLPSPECYASSSNESPVIDTMINRQEDYDMVDLTAGESNDDYLRLAVNDKGELSPKGDQVADYVHRGQQLGDVNLWDFVCQVDKLKKRKSLPLVSALDGSADLIDEGANSDDSESVESESDDADDIESDAVDSGTIKLNEDDQSFLSIVSRSRPIVKLLAGHAECNSHELKVRHPTRRRVPVPIGPAFPRRDVESDCAKYARLMLLIYKPWRTVSDLKEAGKSWHESFEDWKRSPEFSPEIKSLLANMQLLHECKDSRDNHFKDRNRASDSIISADMVTESRNIEEDDLTATVDEEALHELLQDMNGKIEKFGHDTNPDVVNILGSMQNSGLFGSTANHPSDSEQDGLEENITHTSQTYEADWKEAYVNRKAAWRERESLHTSDYDMNEMSEYYTAFVTPVQGREPKIVSNDLEPMPLVGSSTHAPQASPAVGIPVSSLNPSDFASTWGLNKEQTLAFNIIANQSLKKRGFEGPLKMYLSGPAGTGKSRVFNALRAFFEAKNQARRFRVCSYMGIAAKNVGGMTLHAGLCLGKAEKRVRSKEDLISMWNGVDFLLIDEVSMISCDFLVTISDSLSEAKGNSRPFGGINIIFAGDFAQLPPILQSRLYGSVQGEHSVGTKKKEKKLIGRLLWLTIDTVVELKTNMRQQGSHNSQFSELLKRLRIGRCTDADYELLKSRVIGRHKDLDLQNPKWKAAPVIVRDNTAKDALNEQCAIAFAKRTNQTLHWYHSSDKCHGALLANDELISYLQSVHSGKTKGHLGKLPLVLGMPVLITQNFDVEGGIVNGTYGVVKRIRYTADANGKRTLISCVVKVTESNEGTMPHLNSCEVPVLRNIVDLSFRDRHRAKGTITIRRTQVPIIPAFAMTAHRAQGQTLPSVIVDLQSCQGSESPYVMLSRVTSLQGLLILRPFARNKICCNISQDLREENKRLRILSLQTLARESDDNFEVQQALAELVRANLITERPPTPTSRKRNLQPIESPDRLAKRRQT